MTHKQQLGEWRASYRQRQRLLTARGRLADEHAITLLDEDGSVIGTEEWPDFYVEAVAQAKFERAQSRMTARRSTAPAHQHSRARRSGKTTAVKSRRTPASTPSRDDGGGDPPGDSDSDSDRELQALQASSAVDSLVEDIAEFRDEFSRQLSLLSDAARDIEQRAADLRAVVRQRLGA